MPSQARPRSVHDPPPSSVAPRGGFAGSPPPFGNFCETKMQCAFAFFFSHIYSQARQWRNLPSPMLLVRGGGVVNCRPDLSSSNKQRWTPQFDRSTRCAQSLTQASETEMHLFSRRQKTITRPFASDADTKTRAPFKSAPVFPEQ